MDKKIQEKIDKYKKAAKNPWPVAADHLRNAETDSLSKVIRTQKDADNFMSELDRLSKSTK